MCVMLYLASDEPLPLVAWNEECPGFHVSDPDPTYDEVRQWLSKPHVYDLGAHPGCACGFSYGEHPDHEKPEDVRKSRETVRQLSEYLGRAVTEAGELELYSWWNGEESNPPSVRKALSPSRIGGDAFWFEEGQLTRIVPEAP